MPLKTNLRLFSALLFLFYNLPLVHAGIGETLPTYHWAYPHLEQLRLRGFLKELNFAVKPFTRGELAASLVNIRNDANAKTISSEARWILDELYSEFEPEMKALSEENGGEMLAGLLTQAGIKRSEGSTHDWESFHTKVGFQAGKDVYMYNSMNFDADLPDDSTSITRQWRGISGFTEQGYINIVKGNFSASFGRDFRRWGVGRSGTLLLSDYSRPLDQIFVRYTSGPFDGKFLVAELDSLDVVRRFISSHRLDIKLNDKISFGITELVIYSRENGGLQLLFLNPMLVFHGEQLTHGESMNTFGSVDLLYYPKDNWKISAAFMIDDVQFDNKIAYDLEPNEIGIILGVDRANSFGIAGLDLWGEYVRITNRTYRTRYIGETLLHRKRPLGYFLGNDFDRVEIGLSMWLKEGLKLGSSFSRLRDGEGGIYQPFDTPWLDFTVAEGYSEKFPTGIVQTISTWNFNGEFRINRELRINAEFAWSSFSNAGNTNGANDIDTTFFFGLWYDFSYLKGF